MSILALNAGSSTLKFALFDDDARAKHAGGVIEWDAQQPATVTGTMREVLENQLRRDSVRAVGHRVVHGGERFVAPTRIDEAVLSALDELSELAPLHNPAALQAIRAARDILGRDVPLVAVFDTAFFSSLPAFAATYALPHEITERHRIRRYGFHGLAHESMLRRYAEIHRIPVERATIITLQLGNGCSVTAIRSGRAVDTSMGFTPLEGLVMGTRCGDIDPGLVGHLSRAEKISVEELERLLNEKSGLLGVSGRSSDMRDLLAAETTDARAALAIEMFCYRARKYIGAFLAALGGAQAVVFGGGIGENSPEIRARICQDMSWCGLEVDAARNAAATGKEARITTENSTLHAHVIAVDESVVIAQNVQSCLRPA
jgi:acetate kinase